MGCRTECKDCVKRKASEHRKQHKEQNNRTKLRYYYKLRTEAIRHYSNGTMKCNCCGESHDEFLTIDHVNNDGAAHRKTLNTRGIGAWLKKAGYPSGFQVLCMNCNCAKQWYGMCPHEAERLGVEIGSIVRSKLMHTTDRARGERHPRAKLTEEVVLAVRAEYAEGQTTQTQLAEKYGISRSAVSSTLIGRNWSHVHNPVSKDFGKRQRSWRSQGEANGNSKLKDEQVMEIRSLLDSGESQSSLARRFGVHQSTIWRIKNR